MRTEEVSLMRTGEVSLVRTSNLSFLPDTHVSIWYNCCHPSPAEHTYWFHSLSPALVYLET